MSTQGPQWACTPCSGTHATAILLQLFPEQGTSITKITVSAQTTSGQMLTAPEN